MRKRACFCDAFLSIQLVTLIQLLDGNLTIIFEPLQELYELSDANSYFLRGLDCKSGRFADNLLRMTQNLMLSAKNLASHHSSFE